MTHNYNVHWFLSAVLICVAFVAGMMTGRNPELVEPVKKVETKLVCEYAEPSKTPVVRANEEDFTNGEYRPYLQINETPSPVWEGGPSSFYRDDELGHKCWYDNTWMGVGRQYILNLYCWKDGDELNIYYENDPTPHPL